MPKIPEYEIEHIKQSVDLISLCRSRGIKLKKVGKNYVGRCPFHEEDNASFVINPERKLWNCFGCGKGGDAIRLVELLDNVSFREAVKTLSSKAIKTALSINSGQAVKGKMNSSFFSRNPSANLSSSCPERVKRVEGNRPKLLSLVADYYHAAFNQRKEGRDYLKKRGLLDLAMFSRFKIGFCAGNIRESMPKDDLKIAELKNLGVLTENGREFFTNCVVFPIPDQSGQIVNLYGRRIRNGQVNHLYLPGPKQGVFNGLSLKTADQIILVESILDALVVIQAGYSGVVPCYGSAGIPEDLLSLLKKFTEKSIFLCFDSDAAGRKAASKSKEQLESIGITARQVILPDGHDPCSLLQEKTGKSKFKQLIRSAGGQRLMGSNKEVKPSKVFKENGQLYLKFPDRTYEVKGISPSQRYGGTSGNDKTKCRITVKVKANGNGQFFLDTIDLYSAKSRSIFARAMAEIFSVRDAQISSELLAMIDPIENFKKEDFHKDTDSEEKQEMTEEEKNEALSFLTASDIFEKILEDFDAVGITGEETNKLIGYLAAVSRKLDEPLSVCIQSRSAAGKSALQNAILDFVPPEDLIRYTRVTGQALFYKTQHSLKHKIIAIEEEVGAREANYSIRTIQSSKYLSIASAGRDPQSGKMRTDEHRVEGPVVIFITTTEPELDGETASRFIFITIDESREATARILEMQRKMDTLEGLVMKFNKESIINRHRNAQRLLRDGFQVNNPYSPYLKYHTDNIRARRDHIKYLTLIKVIAYLRQYQREIKVKEVKGGTIEYVIATLDDIRDANRLAAAAFGSSLDELSPPSRKLLTHIREMVLEKSQEQKIDSKDYSFSRRNIREYTGWSDFQVKTHIRQLADLEYLYCVSGKKGKEYVYELRYDGEMDSNQKFLAGLADVDELAKIPIDTDDSPNL